MYRMSCHKSPKTAKEPCRKRLGKALKISCLCSCKSITTGIVYNKGFIIKDFRVLLKQTDTIPKPGIASGKLNGYYPETRDSIRKRQKLISQECKANFAREVHVQRDKAVCKFWAQPLVLIINYMTFCDAIAFLAIVSLWHFGIL